ncbi:MAG: CocE/NonD family hydrolase [Syntrophorhabdaceae bacterium]|nr:CocE/NonD family hydrolase [Syntrophorhabdaceae bacterium]
MGKRIFFNRINIDPFRLTMIIVTIIFLPAVIGASGIDRPTSNPYEVRPKPDGYLPYLIIPIPDGITIERDVFITMPDGVKLAANIFRPNRQGKFPVILSVTPYGKDQTPPSYKPDGTPLPNAYTPFMFRVYSHGADLGHMRISMLTPWEAPDPAFWVPNDYVVMIVDQRGGFKSEGKPPTPAQGAEDIASLIEWAAKQEWSNGNVGMIGVSALAMNQYDVASKENPPAPLKAIIPWEGASNMYRDLFFWGGIPETNFSRSLGPFKANLQKMPPEQAAKVWVSAMDPVVNQNMLKAAPVLERISVPALICASWSDKGLHTQGTFEVWRRIASKDKWLYIHGGKKWERFYSEDGLAYQKKFFDYYLKGLNNGWPDTPRVRLEVRETRDEYTVRFEKEFPLARTVYQKLYLNGLDNSLITKKPSKTTKIVYHSTQGGSTSFGITFDKDTEITGYMKVKLWVSALDSDDMDLFVTVRKFAGPCDVDSPVCKAIEEVTGKGRIAKGNEIRFRGMNGFNGDMAARGQMRVSQRELDEKLSTPWLPVQRFQGEKRLKKGEIVPVEIAILPSSTFFRKGESLSLTISGHCPVDQPLLSYDWLINKGRHAIYTGGKFDSYLQIPVIP